MPMDGGPATVTYEQVEAIMMTSCAFATCHGGAGAGAAELNFMAEIGAGRPLTEVLVGQAACQYDAMPLVDPGRPENSWLMVKLVGPHMGGRIEFTPAMDWDPGLTPDAMGRYPASICPLTDRGEISFVVLMPQGSSMGLSADRVELIRTWILNGAPGPE